MSTVTEPVKRHGGYLLRQRKEKPGILELFAPRLPMTQLPDEYRVTEANPDPPLVHFAIPIDLIVLRAYASTYDIALPGTRFPDLNRAVKQVAEHAQYDIHLCWPFRFTADCGVLLELYDNYTMEKKILVEEDEEDVIQMVQEELLLHESLRPKWYFDFDDPWRPGCEDEDEDGDDVHA